MAGRTQRRLAAIVMADVVGYSRLMGADESGTLEAMRTHRLELWDPAIESHGGRVVNRAGDSALIEFGSAVSAMECSIAIQTAMAERNKDVAEDMRVALRVGVNVGEVVVEGEEIYGDGVNIAARLQTLAEPGGIALSGNVFENVVNRLDLPLVDDGAHSVKNIERPVHVWRWSPTTKKTTSNLAVESEPLPLPDKPSIAVLPFDNLSGDSEQEFFADGMTEDIITGLSQFGWLFVIARNSTFTFKGRAVVVSEVAKAFGVRYVLEGSVRKAGNRVRVTAQLIDAENDGHIWADRYDRNLEDIFVVQDEITEAIVAAIAPEIDEAERRLAQRKPPGDLDIWSRYQRGLAAYYTTTKEALESAIEQFDEINRLDPTFASAFALGADTRYRILIHYPGREEELEKQARDKARIGLALDPRNPICLMSEGRVYSYLGQHEVAIAKAEEAVSLNPNSAMANYGLGFILGRAGRCDDAIAQIDLAIRLSPRDAFIGGFFAVKSIMLFQMRRYQDALAWARRASTSPNPRPGMFLYVAAALVKLDRREEAAAEVADLLLRHPETSLIEYRQNNVRIFPRATEATEILIEALREAGLPE